MKKKKKLDVGLEVLRNDKAIGVGRGEEVYTPSLGLPGCDAVKLKRE